jgi:choline dehydrogenase-like flavoprotein
MLESDAYPQLYQSRRRARRRDRAINILQGRCVGGGTTVNWTSSFRTPPATLAYWQREFGLTDFTVEAMAPWFAKMEAAIVDRAVDRRTECQQ